MCFGGGYACCEISSCLSSECCLPFQTLPTWPAAEGGRSRKYFIRNRPSKCGKWWGNQYIWRHYALCSTAPICLFTLIYIYPINQSPTYISHKSHCTPQLTTATHTTVPAHPENRSHGVCTDNSLQLHTQQFLLTLRTGPMVYARTTHYSYTHNSSCSP